MQNESPSLEKPQDTESEKVVLASMIADPTFRARCLARLDDEAWHDISHKAIASTIRRFEKNGVPVDDFGLQMELMTTVPDIALKLDGIASAYTIQPAYYAARVAECYRRRKLINSLQETVARLYEGISSEEALEQVTEVKSQVESAGSEPGVITMKQAIRDAFREVDESQDSPQQVVPTGLKDLDNMLGGGFRGGQLIVLGARPAMGKSGLARQIAFDVAKTGKPTLFVGMEMTYTEQAIRTVSAESGVAASVIQQRAFDEGQATAISKASKMCAEVPFLQIDSQYNANKICSMVRRAHQDTPLGLLVVDYLQLCESESGSRNREAEVASMSRGFKKLASELRIPVLLLSQLNRAVESRSIKRPQLSDLRESGAIEQDANVALLLWRPEVYDDSQPGFAELLVAKNRGGNVGSVSLSFDGPSVSFRDYAPAIDDSFQTL
jgi:replicative DNA helicase